MYNSTIQCEILRGYTIVLPDNYKIDLDEILLLMINDGNIKYVFWLKKNQRDSTIFCLETFWKNFCAISSSFEQSLFIF